MNLLLFELKLILRNKRLRQVFFMSFILVIFILYPPFMGRSATIREYFILQELFIIGCIPLHGSFFATLAFSINGSFWERLMTSPLPVKNILASKYRFLCIISLADVLLMSPCLFLGVKLFQLIAAYLYVIGFVFFGFFYISLFPKETLDIKATSFYNWQGYDISSQLLPCLFLLFAIGFIAFIYWLFGETATYTVMSAIGIAFIATHKIWLDHICRKFEKTKYKRLECFREDN
ncbi:MAG: DUF5687 family protein [Tannerella sp.]|jgi:hypothetical protein|nr:DUF5687 family protein [Tannerella sp.]